ncbi:MAG: fused DSP-PTPase phosphatase/NAD kinase-like protein, partial [Rudaea sp.]
TVLDLRGGSAHKHWEQKEAEAAGMQYVSIPLSGFFAPSYQQMTRILAVLQDQSYTPVFVHCHSGVDRAGVVTACYRIVHDHWTNQMAPAEAREGGMRWLQVLMRRFVHHFDPSRLKANGDAGCSLGRKRIPSPDFPPRWKAAFRRMPACRHESSGAARQQRVAEPGISATWRQSRSGWRCAGLQVTAGSSAVNQALRGITQCLPCKYAVHRCRIAARGRPFSGLRPYRRSSPSAARARVGPLRPRRSRSRWWMSSSATSLSIGSGSARWMVW